jgi:protein-L-isoaspartate(D-aspartate) O-methyltransferase
VDMVTVRQRFADELRYVAHVRSDRVIAAFAAVPRERFLGSPPWRVYDQFTGEYWTVPSADPTAAYHNVLYAIDTERGLNNGQPEFWARLFDRLTIRAGDAIVHIGAGLGYYTAIIAELTGPTGHVLALEVDPELAKQARANLAGIGNVQLETADGSSFDPGPSDVVVVNAGATHPLPLWLNILRPGGRLLLPLTPDGGLGTVFRFERLDATQRYAASAASSVGIYPCRGARTPEAGRALARALAGGGQRFVRSLRRDTHACETECWLHGDGYCLSLRPA